jgi:HAD superfamily hydrolase (TIGR01509 family)
MLRDTLLFDLDGTLTDTDKLHFEAYRRLLTPFGKSVTVADYKGRIMGATNAAIMDWLFPDLGARHIELANEKERLFRSQLTHMEPLPGLMALLDWADAHKIKMAVVTNAPRENAETMLKGLGLSTRFPVLVIGDELARGKPDPLPYATALERLGSRKERALAFEDSRSGVAAASAAGIETIGLRTGLDDATLRAAGAAATIGDFADAWFLDKLARDFGSAPTVPVLS